MGGVGNDDERGMKSVSGGHGRVAHGVTPGVRSREGRGNGSSSSSRGIMLKLQRIPGRRAERSRQWGLQGVSVATRCRSRRERASERREFGNAERHLSQLRRG